MRIEQPGGMFGDPSGKMDKSKKAGEKGRAKHVSRDSVNASNFSKQLDNVAEEQLKKSLDELIEELGEQAKVLEKRRTFDELEKYKGLVKSFMETAIKKIYAIKVSDSSKLMTKRKKVYVIVEKVDAELEMLTRQILNRQAPSMDILATLDRIRGMLVDMYS